MDTLKLKSCQTHSINTFFYQLIAMIISASSLTVQAESANELMSIARHYITTAVDPQLKNPQITITPISAMANKPNCSTKPLVSMNNKTASGNITLTIVCEQPAWRQYVSAKVIGELPVLISTQDIAAGTPITADQVAVAWRPSQQISQHHLRDISSLEYQSARQFIAKGTAIQQHQLKNSLLIKKNDLVTIVSADPRFQISMNGVALESGSMGQAIKIKNLSSGKTIKAYVHSADTVVVR